VALGDSYTIGTGLDDVSQNFPSLLARRIKQETGIGVALTNLGVNGYTATDLIRDELPVAGSLRPELITILIGANDVVQRSGEAAYKSRLTEIYDALELFGLAAERVLVLSIPDFSALPGAAPFGTASDLRAQIDVFNRIAQSEAATHRFGYVDISVFSPDDSLRVGWLASDNLHPGPAQHQVIADRIWEIAAAWRSVPWDRWSGTAERMLGRAKAEAEALHHLYIGTEHLLLALLRGTDDAGAQLLKRHRVTYREVRKIVDDIVGKSHEAERMPSKIIPTTRVRKVLRIATREAGTSGADSIGTEHILLALMIEGEGIAAHVLSDFGLTPIPIRTGIDHLKQSMRRVNLAPGRWSRLIARLLGKR
jgi:ATP-dependent Clp protease ATP-binding subunit ClpC